MTAGKLDRDTKACPGCGERIILETQPRDIAVDRLRHLIGECSYRLDPEVLA